MSNMTYLPVGFVYQSINNIWNVPDDEDLNNNKIVTAPTTIWACTVPRNIIIVCAFCFSHQLRLLRVTRIPARRHGCIKTLLDEVILPRSRMRTLLEFSHRRCIVVSRQPV